jgi:hypothetical protein
VFASGTHAQRLSLTTYYLVLALGVIHVSSKHPENEQQSFRDYQNSNFSGGLSSEALFIKALETMNFSSQTLQPSIPMIQIVLLICIYGSYKPSGNRQWQLAGIAIRVWLKMSLIRFHTPVNSC